MKKQFQSKSVPRGTRTIWRYLGALLLMFTFAIGNVMAADVATTFDFANGSTDGLTIKKSGTVANISYLVTNSTYNQIPTLSDGNYFLGMNFTSNSQGVLDVITTNSFTNIKSISFDCAADNNSNPKIAVYIIDDKDAETAVQNAMVMSSGSTKVWRSKKSGVGVYTIDLSSSPKTGKVHFKFTTGSSGKSGAIDNIVITTESAAPGGDPVDPTFTYTPATYTIGDPALDLSTKLTSTNTTGAITFAIKDAAGTGATIANSKNFTATTVGTAKVTVTQAASTGYNAKSQDIDVTVAAPDPCTTYFHFVATADATANGKTNWNGFTNAPTGSNDQSNSVTIDGSSYTLTKRTGSTGEGGTILGFTIPANKAGTLYGYMKSSGTGARTLSLKKGDDVVKTNTEITDGNWTLITISAIAPGTYTLSPDKNVQIQMFALKVCDAEFHTITLDLDGGTGTTSISALDGAPATKPADPTKENADFVKWVVKSTGNDYDWTSNVTGDLTLKAVWSQWPKLTLEAGEGATGDDVVAYYAASTPITVPVLPTGFSNGTKEFTGWVYSSDVEITDGAFPMPSSNLTLTAQWASATAVAQIVGGDSYETFAAAIAAVTDGQTIQLLQDIDVDAQIEIAGVDITIDLNGHKIEYVGDATLPSGVILVHNGASLTINDSSDPSAGSIVSGDKAYAAVALTKLGDDASTPATLVVNGGALTGYYYGITGNGSRNNTVITINGGTITGTVGIAIYHPQVGTLTVNDGSLTGVDAAIEMRAGTLVINDGTFTATATEFSCNPNGSGSTTTGAAIAIAQHTTKKEISVTINGGSFNGVKALNESNPQVNDPAPQVTMAVTAGTFTGEVTTVDVNNFISGGTFSKEVAANQCAEGYAPKDNGNNTYGVKPLATSIDFEALADTHGTGTTDVRSELEAKNYTFSGSISKDNGASWDAATAAKPADKGLKIKGANGATLSFDVAAGKLVTLKVGSLKGGATIAVNGGTAEQLTGSNPLSTGASVYTYYYSADVATYSIATTGTDYDVIQSVTIEDPYVVTFNANGGEDVTAMEFHGTALTLPSATKGSEVFKGWYDAAEGGNLIGKANESYTPTASVTLHAQWETVSSDATLSALEVDDVALAGFDPETYIYNIVCEYGQQPTITKATATAGTLATVTINNTPVDEGTYKYVQVKVVPQSGEEGKKFYQVRYTNLPKKGVSLIKATHTGAKTADVTGYLGGTYDKNTANDGKLGDANTYFGIKLTEGNFQAGDVLYIHASTVSSAVRIYSDKGTTRINAEDGTFDANKMFTYTLTAETEWIYIYRKVKDGESDMNPYVDYIEVQRHMDPFIAELKVGDALATIDEEANPKTITIEVPASTDITALTPSIKAYANGGATVTPADPQDFSAGAVAYTVTSYYGETTTYQVTVTKAEASHDATLSALSVEGYNLSPAFDPAVLTYNVELAKGTVIADLPAVSYTLNHAGATAVKTNATVLPGATTIVVTAEDGLEENKKTYTINFTVSTKDIITIFDGSTMDAIATSPDATSGASWEAVGLSVSSSDKVSGYTHIIATGGSTGTSKYIAVTIPENYAPQFVITHATNSNGNERNAMIGTSNTRPALEDALFVVASSSSSSASEGTSGVLSDNTTYYIHADQSINFVKIQLILEQLAPKCAAPVISGLADVQVCDIASAELNGTATVDDGGTVSYKWYAEGGTDVLATTATYTPTAVGNYYVVATNTLADHRDNSTTSEVVSVSLYEATSVTMSNISGKAAASIALNAVATGANPHYAWFTCDDAEGNNAVAIAGAADAASYAIPTPVATQYYKVVVTTDCGNASAVALVTLLPDIVPLADVTENTVWDWAEITARADGSEIDEVIDNKNHGPRVATANGLVLANYVLGGGYWDKIEGNNNAYAIRNTSNVYYQGASLHMHTTKGGILKINARNDGSTMKMKIGSVEFALTSTFTDYVVYVPAGDVTIENVPETAGKPMRVKKITFTAKATPDYSRDVTNNIGTLCVDHNVLAGGALGATFYQIASRNELYNDKIDFEEVLPNEELKAGEPYIFKSTTGKIELFYGATAVTEPEAVRGMHGWFDAAAPIDPTKFMMLDITEVNKEDILYISSNKLWNCGDLVGVGLQVVNNRAYIVMSDVPTYAEYQEAQTSNPAPRRRVTLGRNAEQVATGIEDVQGDKVQCTKMLINGQLFILRGEKMYDAKGQLVK